MAPKVVHITDKKAIDKIKKIVAEKAHVHQKIREGKFSEINPDIKFVKPV